MQYSKTNKHHGEVSVYNHSVDVALISLKLARRFRIKVDEKSLVRGALLHDYYLYDWHEPDESHRLHGFSHAKKAFINASKDFDLNDIEKDIIIKHMFPLNLSLPVYKESVLVCLADKISATKDYSKQMTWVKEHKEALKNYIKANR
ncbi:MAG: HD domain-containing protein [Lachnospiraceae bacterium]|nr:HD domain-containing protein [Lachnospiraceae bacterium]